MFKINLPTIYLIAFDFDGKEYSQDVLYRDVSAIRDECSANNISVAVERSRSGNGIHFWIFFAENIPASVARKLGSSIITSATNKHHRLALKTYDRLIPNQDTLPKGGFGNLIALPLHRKKVLRALITPTSPGNGWKVLQINQ